MVLISRYSSKPARPISRPLPDCLYPPKGASAEYQTPPLTLTVPTRIPAANLAARSGSTLNTVPDNPYGELLAIRRASASPSWAIPVSTAPKISSRVGRAAAAACERPARRARQIEVALPPVALPRRNARPADGSGLVGVARLA